MKNIVTVLLIFIIPVALYMYITNDKARNSAFAVSADRPSLITFTSTMCMDCKKMKEVIKEVKPEYSERINFININALDKDKKVQNDIKKYGITLVPTLIFLDEEGKEINKTEGYIPKEELVSKLEGMLNG